MSLYNRSLYNNLNKWEGNENNYSQLSKYINIESKFSQTMRISERNSKQKEKKSYKTLNYPNSNNELKEKMSNTYSQIVSSNLKGNNALSNNQELIESSQPIFLSELEKEYFNNKTNYILKNGKLPLNYQRINSLIDKIPIKTGLIISQSLQRLKVIIEDRDKILVNEDKFPKHRHQFSLQSSSNSTGLLHIHQYIKENLSNWNELFKILYDEESLWLKIIETLLFDIKILHEESLKMNKDLNEKNIIIDTKINEINYLNDYIKKNDVSSKSNLRKAEKEKMSQLKKTFLSKEKINLIEKLNFEEQIVEITSLLEKEKNRNVEINQLKEELNEKKKEVEDLRLKLYQESEEKKLKISYLNNERKEIENDLNSYNNEISKMNLLFEESIKKEFYYKAKLRQMNKEIGEKERNIEMSKEEIDRLYDLLMKEKKLHKDTLNIFDNFQERQNEIIQKNVSMMNVLVENPFRK
jgi:hypothetical protein